MAIVRKWDREHPRAAPLPWIGFARKLHSAMKDEQRRDRRTRVFLTAMLRSAVGDAEVKLTNLSSQGACTDWPGSLAPGTEVQISRGDLRVPARIAWTRDGRIGIEFAEPVDVQAFRTSGQSAAGSPMPLLKPVEKLSPRLERHWTEFLKR